MISVKIVSLKEENGFAGILAKKIVSIDKSLWKYVCNLVHIRMAVLKHQSKV